MRNSLYVHNGERIKSNASLLRSLCKENVLYSAASELGWFISNREGAFLCIGSWTQVTPKNVKSFAKSFKTYYENEKKGTTKFDKDYVYNTVCEILTIMYDCGLSLKTNAEDIEGFESELLNPSKYPLILLDIDDNIKHTLIKYNIFYVGELLEKSFLRLISILSHEEVNEIYKSIREECLVDVYNIINTNIKTEIFALKSELSQLACLSEELSDTKKLTLTPVAK